MVAIGMPTCKKGRTREEKHTLEKKYTLRTKAVTELAGHGAVRPHHCARGEIKAEGGRRVARGKGQRLVGREGLQQLDTVVGAGGNNDGRR